MKEGIHTLIFTLPHDIKEGTQIPLLDIPKGYCGTFLGEVVTETPEGMRHTAKIDVRNNP